MITTFNVKDNTKNDIVNWCYQLQYQIPIFILMINNDYFTIVIEISIMIIIINIVIIAIITVIINCTTITPFIN